MKMIQEGNLGDFLDSKVALYGNKIALVFEDSSDDSINISYAKLGRAVARVANLLESLGIKEGDKVLTQVHNCPEVVYLYFAIAKLGAILVPTNAYNLAKEATHIINLISPKLIFIEEGLIPLYKELADDVKISVDIKNITYVGRASENTAPFKDFSALAKRSSPTFKTRAKVHCKDLFEIIFTSGTTAFPKGVMITHHNALFSAYYSAWQYALRSSDIFLTCYPAYHVDFQFTGLLPCLSMGAKFIALEKYSSTRFWGKVCYYRATITEVIPKMINTLLLQKQKSWELNHNLREVLYFLTLPVAKMQAFSERFGVPLFTSYGMSESIVGVIGDRPGDTRRWPSLGRIGFTYEIKIADETGKEVEVGKIGEICIKGVRGENMFLGYYENEAATKASFDRELFFHTGDMGYIDDRGYFYFVDRSSNIIKTSGENISSIEVENIIATHKDVLEAAVVGVINEVGDEVIKAYVVCNSKGLTIEEIRSFCTSHMARFKIPTFIEIIEELPRNQVGKIDKNKLRLCELPLQASV